MILMSSLRTHKSHLRTHPSVCRMISCRLPKRSLTKTTKTLFRGRNLKWWTPICYRQRCKRRTKANVAGRCSANTETYLTWCRSQRGLRPSMKISQSKTQAELKAARNRNDKCIEWGDATQWAKPALQISPTLTDQSDQPYITKTKTKSWNSYASCLMCSLCLAPRRNFIRQTVDQTGRAFQFNDCKFHKLQRAHIRPIQNRSNECLNL